MACKVKPNPRGPFSITIGGRSDRDKVLALRRLGDLLQERGESGGLSKERTKDRHSSSDTAKRKRRELHQHQLLFSP